MSLKSIGALTIIALGLSACSSGGGSSGGDGWWGWGIIDASMNRKPAFYAIRNLIREGKTRQIRNAITMGQHDGMFTLEQSLSSLVNYISQDVAGAERIYADLLAQYEKKRIAGSMTYTPRPGARKRL